MEFFRMSMSMLFFLGALVCCLLVWGGQLLYCYWWRTLRIQKMMEEQGMKGLPYRFIMGSIPEYASFMRKAHSRLLSMQDAKGSGNIVSHDIMPRVLPHYAHWLKIFGQPFFYWYGAKLRVTIVDKKLVKEVLNNKFGEYDKLPRRPDFKEFLGRGLLAVTGDTWVYHRRLIMPAFHIDKIKNMIPIITSCASEIWEGWNKKLEAEEEEAEIDVAVEFRRLTADIIARSAFGSSYKEGRRVFEMQRQQQLTISESDHAFYIPGTSFLPTSKNQRRWNLDKEIKSSLRQIIHRRLEQAASNKMWRTDSKYGNDLLGLMLSASTINKCNNNDDDDDDDEEEEEEDDDDDDKSNTTNMKGNKKAYLSMDDIVDECQTFFFAGHETTSALLTWTMMLLAIHVEWQERARAEVLALLGDHHPCSIDWEIVKQLKIVGMILAESLRLYSPAIKITRYCGNKDTRLGEYLLPKGTTVVIPLLALHHNKEVWGDDVHEFKPERFAGEINLSHDDPRHAGGFLPFSIGPRFCVGHNLAKLESKLILIDLLRLFSFRLSPSYRHAPTNFLTLQPQYGMQILLRPLINNPQP